MTFRTFWRVQWVVWPLYGLIHYIAALPAIPAEERWHMAGIKAVRALAGLIVSSSLPLLFRRILDRQPQPAVVVASAAGIALVLGNVWLALDRALLTVVRSATPLQVNWARFPHGFDLDYMFVLLAWSGGYVALRYWEDAARRREESLKQTLAAREAQLRALAFQLSPHFLFNTLNSLRSAIAEDQDRAREMVTRLSRFMRYSLAVEGDTALSDEIDMARAYLAIEQARFERAVEVSIEVDAVSATCLVPSLLLQPLVENAVRHGRPDPGGVRRVRVTSRLDGRRLHLEVANQGELAPDAMLAAGLGVRNTRERLAHAYGDRQRIQFVQDREWVRVIVEIEEPRHAAAPSVDR